jgi:hypothetical protein
MPRGRTCYGKRKVVPNKRTATIRAFVERQRQANGRAPTAQETAAMMAISLVRAEYHYRILGLL